MLNPLEFLKNHWRWFAVFLLCLGSYITGARSVSPVEKIVTQEKIVEKTVETSKSTKKNDVTTTIVKKPDGTTTTTIVDHTEKTHTSTSESTHQETKTKVVSAPPPKPDYRVGVLIEVPATARLDDKTPSYTAEVAKRVAGDLWIDAQYNFTENHVALGLSYEF